MGAVKEQREALQAAGVASAWSLLGISVPAAVPAGLALGGAPPIAVAIAGVGAVALGLTNWYVQRRAKRAAPDGDRPCRAWPATLRNILRLAEDVVVRRAAG